MSVVNTNIIQLSELSPLSEVAVSQRQSIRITDKSLFGDDFWDFSSLETNPNVKPSLSILRWDFSCGQGRKFTDSSFNRLRTTFKELIYELAVNPIGKRPAIATLKKKYDKVRMFIKWLIEQKFHCISTLNYEDITPYLALVNRNENEHPMTKLNKLSAVKLFWDYRANIRYPLMTDPLNGASSFTVADVKRSDIADNKYDYIPDSIAQNLIRACVDFIREQGVVIAAATQARDTANLNEIKRGKSKANRDRAKRAALEGFELSNAEVTTLSRQLLAACYLVIGFFTGLRASEMLSMKPGRINKEDGVTWVHGRQIKIAKKDRKWMAPDIVFEAHHLAKSLTQPMRDAVAFEMENTSDLDRFAELQELGSDLFLNWSSKRDHGLIFEHAPQVSNIRASIHTSLKELVNKFDVVDENQELWNLHPHQLRKTFVRFICANAMNIRYLQEHMGHRSLDMTAWYDSDDVELTDEITKQLKAFKKEKLDAIFNSGQHTTGAGAEPMEKERQDFFVGIASTEDKDEFIDNLADDITMRSTGHSWCLGDSNNGSCTGVVGCMMDVSMTQKCKSALITEEHLPAWQKIKARNEQLMQSEQLGKYQKQAIAIVMKETIEPTIAALTSDNKGDCYA